ncbi:MAG: caspase family protein, partial [Acidobacteriota bacterium]
MNRSNSVARLTVCVFVAGILLSLVALLNAQDPRNLEREKAVVQSAKRTALVIGNGAYTAAPALKNPPNDARDMAATLKALGFDVTSGIDVRQRDFKRLIREFGQKLKGGGSGLFYYAGHGVQSKGRNYLIPIDAEVMSEADVEDTGVDLSLILNYMDDAANGLNIVILDACRNNPFARSFRSATGGLAQVDAPTGTLIAYATAPGTVASDGADRNGLYTSELLKQMQAPGQSATDMFMRVRAEVMKKTAGKQVPWESSSLVGAFYFSSKAAASKSESELIETVVAKDPAAIEREGWSYIKDSKEPNDFRDFLKDFPSGANANNAKIKLEQATWDSVKESKNKALIHAYMEEFSDGVNRPLAKIKLRQLGEVVTDSTVAVNSRDLSVTGKFIGHIQDAANGQPIAGSKVLFTNLESNVKVTALADPGGNFTKDSIKPGSYKIEVSAEGYVLRETRQKLYAADTYTVLPDPFELERVPPETGTSRKDSYGIDLIYIPPGQFTMGSNKFPDEKPIRKVTIKDGFWIGKFEVTQEQYQRVTGTNPSYFKDCPRCPVQNVSWTDATAFIKKLNAADDGFQYSLPSEAQWEYVARAGGDTTATL